MSALAFVYLVFVAVAAPLHMLDAGVTGSDAILAQHAADGLAGHGDVPHAGGPHPHAGVFGTGDVPDAPHEHGADCLTCGLLTMPGSQAVASAPSQLPARVDAVFAPRGLAVSDRAVPNPRLRGPPVT